MIEALHQWLETTNILYIAIAIAMGMLFFAVIIVVWNLVSIGWNDHSSGCYNIYESPATSSSTENLLFVDIHKTARLTKDAANMEDQIFV